jgi:hypothetical protein
MIAYDTPANQNRKLVADLVAEWLPSATALDALHNYAPVLPLWDRLLGTFLDPSGVPQPPAGLADDPNPPGLWAQLVSPLGWC